MTRIYTYEVTWGTYDPESIIVYSLEPLSHEQVETLMKEWDAAISEVGDRVLAEGRRCFDIVEAARRAYIDERIEDLVAKGKKSTGAFARLILKPWGEIARDKLAESDKWFRYEANWSLSREEQFERFRDELLRDAARYHLSDEFNKLHGAGPRYIMEESLGIDTTDMRRLDAEQVATREAYGPLRVMHFEDVGISGDLESVCGYRSDDASSPDLFVEE